MKFHPIHIDPASGIRLPERMNNPFCYEPHPLCIMACKELQEKIAQRDDWREEIDRGKMFGVLIVVSSSMVCSGYWALSLFLWACLLMVSHALVNKVLC